MIVAELIRRKRDGNTLTQEEIKFLVQGAANSTTPDYQLAAWLMAVFFRGMTEDETFAFTRAIKETGFNYQWKTQNPELQPFPLVDKHSTGGVGDKATLILIPLAIQLGLKVPMISGRGLGHTGGTVDKLTSIPGFKMEFSPAEAAEILLATGGCMLSQTAKLCPADKKLYHLRDVTGTVESYPLIAASIVSKKWAGGCESLVYDVKFGSGAFMPTAEKAEELGNWLLEMSSRAKLRARVLLTRMEEPLGSCVGNALEVKESVWILKNNYPSAMHKEIAAPLKKLCCELAAHMAQTAGIRKNFSQTVSECEGHLESGEAFAVFDRLAKQQGAHCDWFENLPTANVFPIKALSQGFVEQIHSRELGTMGLEIGIGRRTLADNVKNEAGFEILKKIGDRVAVGEVVGQIHMASPPDENIQKRFRDCFVLNPNEVPPAKELLWKILQPK